MLSSSNLQAIFSVIIPEGITGMPIVYNLISAHFIFQLKKNIFISVLLSLHVGTVLKIPHCWNSSKNTTLLEQF
jgi:hypothetical protein